MHMYNLSADSGMTSRRSSNLHGLYFLTSLIFIGTIDAHMYNKHVQTSLFSLDTDSLRFSWTIQLIIGIKSQHVYKYI